MLGLHIWFVQATSKGTWSNWEGRETREEEGEKMKMREDIATS